MPDLSKLSNEDLLALKGGDYSKLSNEGLLELQSQYSQPQPHQQPQASPLKTAMERGMGGPIGLAGKAMGVIQEGADRLGQKTAETLAQEGLRPPFARESIPVSPEIAAGVGTAVSMTPDIAMSVGGPQGAIRQTAGAIKSGIKGMVPEVLKNTGDEQVGMIREKLVELPVKMTEKGKALDTMRGAAKQGIQAAEKAAGIEGAAGMSSSKMEALISNKKSLSNFADRMGRISEKGPAYLAEKADIKTLQRFNKVLQEGIKKGGLNDVTIAQMEKSRAVIKEAIGLKAPGVKEALGSYKTIEEAISALPKEAQAQAKVLRLALRKAQNLAKRQAEARGLLKKGAAVAVGGAVAKKLGLF